MYQLETIFLDKVDDGPTTTVVVREDVDSIVDVLLTINKHIDAHYPMELIELHSVKIEEGEDEPEDDNKNT